MKKIFLSVLTLAAFSGGIALTSCGGGGGGGGDAQRIANITIEQVSAIGLMKIELYAPLSNQTVAARYSFDEGAPYDGYFNVLSMKDEANTVVVDADFGIKNGDLLNDSGFLAWLGMGNAAASCQVMETVGGVFTFNIGKESGSKKSGRLQLRGKVVFYEADNDKVAWVYDTDDDDEENKDGSADLSKLPASTILYTGQIKPKED